MKIFLRKYFKMFSNIFNPPEEDYGRMSKVNCNKIVVSLCGAGAAIITCVAAGHSGAIESIYFLVNIITTTDMN